MKENGEQLTLGSVLQESVLDDGFVQKGDQPFLNAIIAANKALLAKDLAKVNIKRLEQGATKIYDIRYLF